MTNLDSRVVCQPKRMPDNNVVVVGVVLAIDPGTNSLGVAPALVRVLAARVQLVVAVLRHPYVVVRKLGTRMSYAVRVSQHWLRGHRYEFVRALSGNIYERTRYGGGGGRICTNRSRIGHKQAVSI